MYQFLKNRLIYHTHKVLIDHIIAYKNIFKYSQDEDGTKYAILKQKSGMELFYYYMDSNNSSEYIPRVLAKKCGIKINEYLFLRDYITRYVYPHMLPIYSPEGSIGSLYGFHGQHKDSIVHISDIYIRNKLYKIFNPLPDDIIMDCGAYVGYGELRISPYLSSGTILSIEASSQCFKLLKKNIEKNSLGNVISVNKAIWKQNGKLTLKIGDRQGNSLIGEITGKNNNINEEVEAVSIDSLVSTYSLKKVDFVSLTLNGAEPEALMGMKNTLRMFGPRLRIAGGYKRNGIPIWKICKDFLKDYDYKIIVGHRGNVFAVKNEILL